ncbi:MAG TPA: hypothetical protein VH815_03100 [Acidobacteriota bacterium]|jgi:hypothetical protein
MATIGLPGDVNNSVFMTGAYPVGRAYGYVPAAATAFDVRNNYAGEIGGLNQDYRGMMVTNASQVSTQTSAPAMVNNDNGKKPAIWWITFAIVFVIVAWAARKFAPDGENFAIIKPNLINGIFLTLWIVLILVFLKQVAARVRPIPGVKALADLVLSV